MPQKKQVVFGKDFFIQLRKLFVSIKQGFKNNIVLAWIVFILIAVFIILQQLVLWFFIKIPKI